MNASDRLKNNYLNIYIVKISILKFIDRCSMETNDSSSTHTNSTLEISSDYRAVMLNFDSHK